KILVVDDDKVVLRAVTEILQREGYTVVAIDDAVEGLAASKDPSVDVAVLDIRMPHLSGMDLLRAIKQARADGEVVMMTAFATVEPAVEAVKAGAYDYLTKPFSNIDEVSLTVAKALERKQLKDRTRVLEEQLSVKGQFEDLIGQSGQMRAVFKLVETVSYSSATVLIQGESGTGKELVARAIHYRSPRKDKPFIAVNCSALTHTLLESELFGHGTPEGQVHRGHRQKEGSLRGRRRRDDLPRRDRRRAAGHPGPPAPRAAGGRGEAGGGQRQHQGRRPGHRRQQHRPGAGQGSGQ